MKKAVKIISLALVVVIVGAMLVSCAKMLSGTYSNGIGDATVLGGKSSYTFSGNKVTLTLTISVIATSTTEYKGTYEITKAADGTESIKFTFEDDGSSFSGTYSFEEGKNDTGAYIMIGGSKYYKQ
ncbi:MAG: hypothetical protein IKP68_13180 [Clostridia bacterium]|nr:hypothetical protein [Clostridia bacterium]